MEKQTNAPFLGQKMFTIKKQFAQIYPYLHSEKQLKSRKHLIWQTKLDKGLILLLAGAAKQKDDKTTFNARWSRTTAKNGILGLTSPHNNIILTHFVQSRTNPVGLFLSKRLWKIF